MFVDIMDEQLVWRQLRSDRRNVIVGIFVVHSVIDQNGDGTRRAAADACETMDQHSVIIFEVFDEFENLIQMILLRRDVGSAYPVHVIKHEMKMMRTIVRHCLVDDTDDLIGHPLST